MDNSDDDSIEAVSLNSNQVAGLVVRVTVKNFMCHEHLRVDFNKHINFICGKNGSGKSAILTGLVIGLGGKSSDTNRGSNLKTLIKSGKSQAIIEITLTNVGPKAFKPDIYGEEITITRILNETGSLYRISKSNGRAVNCKKLELNELLDRFKIQINNPISILNQDMAKSFIKTSNPKSLYKFFINGTLLNEVEEALTQSRQVTLPLLQKTLKEKKEELNFICKDLDEIKKKHEKKRQLIQLESEYEQLKVEYNWAQVYASRVEIDKFQTRLQEVQNNIKDLEKKMQTKDGSEKELLNKRANLKTKLKELHQKKDENTSKAMDAERNFNNIVNRYKNLRHEQKVLEKKLQNHNSGYEQTKERLKILDNQNAEAAAKRNQVDSKREALQTKIHELKTVMNTNNNHIRNLTVSLQKKAEELAICNATCHQSTSNIAKVKHRLKELKSNSSELTCYGDYMPRLVEEIERAYANRRFDRKPVGPLGHYIKLNKGAECNGVSFGPVIESIIGGGLLCGFTVDSNKDYEVLKGIFRKLGISNSPQVIISKFSDKVYDVGQYKVSHPKFRSMFDVLDISNHIVANTIIDQVSVENVLLLPTNEDAYSLMEHVQRVPDNCARAVTLNTLYYPAPRYRSYHLNCKKNTTMLQVNKDSLIQDLEENLKNYAADEKERRMKLNSVKEEETSIRMSLAKVEKENQRVNKEIVSSEMELLHLSNEEVSISTEQEALKEDIAYRKKAIDDLKNKLERISDDIEPLKAERDKAEKEKENTSYESFDEEINKIQEELGELDTVYHEISANFEKFKSRINDQQIMLEKIKSSISKIEKDLASKEQEAEKSGLQIDEERCRGLNELKDRLSEVKSEINVIQEFIGNGSIEEITADLQNQIQNVETIQDIIKETEEETRGMKESIKEQTQEFEVLLRDKSKKIKANFKNITKLRNYREELIFDHAGRKLSIIVKTDAKSQNTTSVLSLSGGERSYSMVAFILSLWQEMALPFYFLDEFDVFMDPVNRHLIIKLLMMHARINHNQQFVFFTPNDFKIDVSSDVGIFRMVDPRDDSLSQL